MTYVKGFGAPTCPSAPAGFSPVEVVPQVLFTGPQSSADCCAQVGALLKLYPEWRAVIGSLMVWCGNSQDQTLSAWQRPWLTHAWMVDPKGRVHDSALWNLEALPSLQSQLPKPVDELLARVVPYGSSQQAEVDSLLQAERSDQIPSEQLVYLPGCIVGNADDEMTDEIGFWAAAALVSTERGGFTLDEFKRLMVVPEEGIN